MPKAGGLKRGMIIDIDGVGHIVKTIESKSPSSRGASTLYKIRYNNLQTGQKRDESYKSDDMLKEADSQRIKVQFSYVDGDDYIFMDNEDYSQHILNKDDIEDQIGYILDGMNDITAMLMDGNIIAIELPASVTMEILETAPKIKGASATNRTKTAKLTTGIEIQIPEYLETGEMIKVNTSTGKFMSRD
ncbi:MAG: elongation factor P-like protein YeiP [Gammaproteobacteria bacterium]